jgi:hypothetical protein
VATIASLLREHVTLQVRSVDRLFLQAYVPRLMTAHQVVRFLLDRGFNIPSPALLAKQGRAYVQAIERFAEDNVIPVVRFARGESKEEVARRYLRDAERAGRFGVAMIGVAQEKAIAWRGWRCGGRDAHPHFEYGRQAVYVTHYYFYVRAREWGPAFLKTCAYAPFPVWIWLNGHEWTKRQAQKAGLCFEALDNGFRSTADAVALAGICARLGPHEVQRFFRRWEARLPSPFTAADRRRGYRYALSFRQLELSDTRVFDRPQAGRQWFEHTLRDQLALGRPDNIAGARVADRRAADGAQAPGRRGDDHRARRDGDGDLGQGRCQRRRRWLRRLRGDAAPLCPRGRGGDRVGGAPEGRARR